MQEIWTEKYRPQKLKNIVGQEHAIDRLKAFVKKKSLPHLLFSGPAGVGKCLTGETPILLSSGKLLPIKDIVNKKLNKEGDEKEEVFEPVDNLEVMSMDKNGKIVPQKVSHVYKSKPKSVYEVTLKSGKKIKMTPEHPLLTLREGELNWKKTKNIDKENLIATPLKLPLKSKKQTFLDAFKDKKISVELNNGKITSFNKEKLEDIKYFFYKSKYRKTRKVKFHYKLNEDFAEWLAYVISDGYFNNSSIRFYNTNQKLLDRFKKLTKKVWDIDCKIVSPKEKTPYMKIGKAKTLTFLLGKLLGVSAKQKRKSDNYKLPHKLLISSEKIIGRFLSGYFESELHIGKTILELSTGSHQVGMQIHYLLLRLGIPSRLLFVEKCATNTKEKIKRKYLKIKVSGSRFLKIFREKIPLLTDKKQKLINLIQKKPITNRDVVGISKDDIQYLRKYFDFELEDWAITRKRAGRVFFQKKATEILKTAEKTLKDVKGYKEELLKFKKIVLECNSLSQEHEIFLKKLQPMNIRKKIQKVSGKRTDRLLEFSQLKRRPHVDSFTTILKGLYNDCGMHGKAEKYYNSLTKIPKVKNKLIYIIENSPLAFAQIAENTGSYSSNVKSILKPGSKIDSLERVREIWEETVKELNNILSDGKLKEILSKLKFLVDAEIIWDEVVSIKRKPKETVYDLTVKETHNFIGGFGAVILHNTTSALALSRELFGKKWKNNFLELNASDERGIDTIRTKVKEFARTKAIGKHDFKIIYLDEADSLTRDAQQALRRTMESYANTCRFILGCNWSSKIISPIQSRTAIFRFSPIKDKELKKYLKHIAENENLNINDDALNEIVYIAEGDIRKGVNILQTVASVDEEITKQTVNTVTSTADPNIAKNMTQDALNGKYQDARKKLMNLIIDHGLGGDDIVKEVYKQLMNLDIDDKKKLNLLTKLGEYEFRITEGSDAFVQLEAMLAQFMLIGK